MSWPTLRLVLPLLRPYRGRYLAGILLSPLSTWLALLIPGYTGEAVDRLREVAGRPERGLGPVLVLAGVIVALSLARGATLFLVRMLVIGGSRGFEYDLRNRLFDHLLALDAPFYRSIRTGDLMSRLTSDVDAVRTLVGPVVMYSATALSTLALSLPLMVSVDPVLTVLVMTPLCLLTWTVRWLGPRVQGAFRRSQETFAELGSFAQEDFGGVRVVKAYAREEAEHEAFREISGRHMARSLEGERLSNWMGPIVGGIGEVGTMLLLLVGGALLLRGGLTLGEFIEFAGYQTLLVWPMISVGWVMNQTHRGLASAARLEEVLSARSSVGGPASGPAGPLESRETPVSGEPAAPPSAGAALVTRGTGGTEVEVRGLTFGYGGTPVLRAVSLRAPAGSTVAVVGRTGSGKSTLLGLIPRLWPFPAGTIFIDGRDATRIPLAELRRRIGFVPQESFLFSRTILENIAFALDGESVEGLEERVRGSAAAARLDKDIDQFPRGLAEVVGERGVTLSGGQKQRAAIARALLRDPDLLILDDPLSAVDAQTEAEILANLREAARGRTVLVASHRVSGIRWADRIYVLDEGMVVEEGSHQELLKRGGLYAELHRRQTIAEELERM